jgi:hypothetical protein
MQEMYDNLEIRILARQDEGYPVEITLAGQEFPRGYLAPDIVPWVESPSPEKDGERLFESLFADVSLKVAWATATGQSPRRRIRLRIDDDAPELHTLPWELLRDTTGIIPHTLAADSDTPFSRYLPGQWVPRGLIATRPIRMLVALVNPDDLEEGHNLAALDVETESHIVREALAGLEGSQVDVIFLPLPVTLGALNAELRKGYHILHYVGHGRYSPAQECTFLYMADEENQTVTVRDTELAEMLTLQGDHLRFIFLASCQTARSSPTVAFRGLASQIIAAGVPAVLAMQDLVSVAMARELTATFYRQLLTHGLVDVAVNQARAAVITKKLLGSWGTAALFSRLPNNQIIHFIDLSADQVSHFSQVAAVPRGVTPGGAEKIAASQTLQDTRTMQANVDQMLAFMKEAETAEQKAEQIQAGQVRMSRVELLLSKATLLETEAEQMLQTYIQEPLPQILSQIAAGQVNWQTTPPRMDAPYKAKLRAAMARAIQASLPQALGNAVNQLGPARLEQMSDFITERLLTGFDVAAYQSTLNEAFALLEEARELEPDNVDVSLHVAKLLLALHPDDPGQGQRMLYRLAHRLENPQDDEARLQLGQTLYVQAASQQPANLDLLRQAWQLFVAVGNEEWVQQAERDVVLLLVQKAKTLRLAAEQTLATQTQLKMQQFAQGVINWQYLPSAPPPSSYKARLMAKFRESAKKSMLQAFAANQPWTNPAQQEAAFDLMLNHILADFDDGAFRAKLNEAHAHLEEAAAISPMNGAMLLEKAQVLVWLTPEDAGDERAVLQRVRQGLQEPRDEAEKLYLAQALFALATLGDEADAALVQEARALFVELDLQPWILACDALLSPPFRPVGQWQIQVGDAFGSVIRVWFQPDGTCMGTQQTGPHGRLAQFAGQWSFDPNRQLLQFQGLVNGFQPFALGITIHGAQDNGYIGRGSDGLRYFLMRLA